MTGNREGAAVHTGRLMGRARPVPFVVAVVVVLLLAGCSAPETPPAPDAPRRFDGTPLQAPLPRTLEESLQALEHTLPADLQVKMRTGTERDMIQHWDTVGRWIRNNWLMGNEPKPLREWFQKQYDLRDAEDISWIILTSFWRHVNDRPVDVDGQIRERHGRAEAQKLQAEKHRQEMVIAGRAISASRLGWKLAPRSAPSVSLPNRRSDEASVRVRYLARFRNGLLIMGKQFEAAAGARGGYPDRADEQFRTSCYFVDLETFRLAQVNLPEMGLAEDCVVVGKDAFFHGSTKGRDVIVSLSPTARQTVPTPSGDGWLRLAIGEGRLLTVRPNSVARYDGRTWTTILSSPQSLPNAGEPPRELSGRLWFRDEGPGDGKPGRLSWVTLNSPADLHYFDRDTGWDAMVGFNFRVVWRYDQAPDGSIWILPDGSLVVAQSGSYRVAIFNGRPVFDGERPDMPSGDANGTVDRPTALEFEGNGCAKLATKGLDGSGASLYRVCNDVVRPLLSFKKTEQVIQESDGQYHWGWTPTHIITIDEGTMVIGGEYGGLYLLTRRSDTGWSMRSLDDRLGRPVSF